MTSCRRQAFVFVVFVSIIPARCFVPLSTGVCGKLFQTARAQRCIRNEWHMGTPPSFHDAFDQQSDDLRTLSGLTPDGRSRSAAASTWTTKSGKKPLVILVGFMGATPAIMSRWTKMYKSADMETIEIIPSLQGMLLAHQGFRGKGSSTVRATCKLMEQREVDSEIVMHIFSNNGFIFFGSCLLASPGIADKISAVIIDSAPSFITPTSGATALLAAMRRVEAQKAATGLRWNILRVAMIPVMSMLNGRQRAAWNAWQRQLVRAAHLFILSEQDKMVPPHEIQLFAIQHAARLRDIGVTTEMIKWETGEHCGMLRKDKKRYLQDILNFLHTST
jgi:hypothetical protein